MKRTTSNKVKTAATDAPASAYPAQLKHGMANPTQVYQRADDLHARLPASRGPASAGATPPASIDETQSLQLMGGPAKGPQAHVVYRDKVSGQVVIPSGRVLVRFADGVNAQDRASALQAAGYRIAKVLSYAPHSAWVESLAQDGAAALQGLPALETLADVENVEPQWLSPRAAR